MKPNLIPEKIYLSAIDLEEVGHLLTEANDRDDVEYTRTDAFIEKACSWLKENCKDYIIVDIDNKYEGVDGLFFEDFRNYMKGK